MFISMLIHTIINFVAKLGSGDDIANKLHRIDPNIVKFQLEEAGFLLIEEAFYLLNPNDDLSKTVFAPDTRGITDRFNYKL
jgi:predicted methyltransferase